MMSWQKFAAVALVALAPTPAVFALGDCVPTIAAKEIFPLVVCPARQNTTSTGVGVRFPWSNVGFFFANYRDQFLFPSSMWVLTAQRALTVESIVTRTTTFTGAWTGNYTSPLVQFVKIKETKTTDLVKTFANNDTFGALHLDYPGNKIMKTNSGSNLGNGGGSTLSAEFTSRGPDPKTRNDLTTIIDFRPGGQDPAKLNILVDHIMRISASGNSGFSVWDTTRGACDGGQTAYASASFVNSVPLTTAYGVDKLDTFVWVFRGLALPPPATVQQQIAEIVRLLLTPESLRCSWLDLTADGKLSDDAIAFEP